MLKPEQTLTQGVLEIYQDPETAAAISSLQPFLGNLKRNLVIKDGYMTINTPFITFMLLNPQITRQFQLAAAETIDAFGEAVKNQNSSQVMESVFFVGSRQGEVFATGRLGKPAAYDLPIVYSRTEGNPQEQAMTTTHHTMAIVHTHPPMKDVLAPSVIVDTDRERGGDLHIFLHLRTARHQDLALGESGFIRHPLSIILQDDLENHTTSMLFIREKEELDLLDERTYLQRLRDNTAKMKDAGSPKEVSVILSELGFQSCYLEIPSGQFYNYPPVDRNNVAQIVKDLNL